MKKERVETFRNIQYPVSGTITQYSSTVYIGIAMGGPAL